MIGSLRHRITILKPVITYDNIGQEVESWQEVATVWASVEPLSGKEYFNAQQINSEISTKITLRYLKFLLPHWVVQFGQQRYDILSIINFEERNIYLQLLCSVKVGDKDDRRES